MTDSAMRTTLRLRASSLRDCPRKAVYEASGAPARERTTREERFLWRGKTIGHDYIVFLASSNGWKVRVDSGPDYWLPPEHRFTPDDNPKIIAEQRIDWGLGIGHADAYLTETRTIIECLSSANASDDLIRSKLLQAVLYTEHHPTATNCRVVVIDPSDFSEEQVVLDPRSRSYAELRDEMLYRKELVRGWLNDSERVPDRVCSKPSDAIGHFCQFAEHCFSGWEPPPVEELAADADLIEAVAEFAEAKRLRKQIAADDKAAKQRQDDAQAIIEAADLPAGRDVQVGPFKVRRTAVNRKPTLDWERAEMAGALEPGMLGEFFKPGASYSTYKAERVDMSGDEYGDEVPF